jgi:hypothetical protein
MKCVQVEEYCYLGSRITSDGRSKKDIVSRIAPGEKGIPPEEESIHG